MNLEGGMAKVALFGLGGMGVPRAGELAGAGQPPSSVVASRSITSQCCISAPLRAASMEAGSALGKACWQAVEKLPALAILR